MREFNVPFYVRIHINRYCKTKAVAQCPCCLSWLCDEIWGKSFMTVIHGEIRNE